MFRRMIGAEQLCVHHETCVMGLCTWSIAPSVVVHQHHICFIMDEPGYSYVDMVMSLRVVMFHQEMLRFYNSRLDA